METLTVILSGLEESGSFFVYVSLVINISCLSIMK